METCKNPLGVECGDTWKNHLLGKCGILVKDRHPKVLAQVLFILLLSILDAYFTLYLLSHGAAEINPVMAFFIEHGKLTFFTVKYLLTSFSVIILVVPVHLHLFGIRTSRPVVFQIIAGIFELVILWELYLIFFVVH